MPQSTSEALTCGTIEEKLRRQASLNEQAREALIQRVVMEKGVYTREEWNELVTPTGTCAWTPRDFEVMRSKQDGEATRGRMKAAASSVIDVEAFRQDQSRVAKFCAAIPKGAILHQHANGTMQRGTAKKILETIDPLIDMNYVLEKSKDPNVEVYPDEAAWLKQLATEKSKIRYSEMKPEDQKKLVNLFFLPPQPFAHSFKRFSFPFLVFPVLRDRSKPQLDPDYIQLREFLRSAHSMGIRYVELTKGLRLDPDSIAKLRETAESLEKETGVIVRWNFAFFRNADPKKNGELSEQLLKSLSTTPSREIVGVDLLANEETAPALEAGQQSYAPVLASAYSHHPNYSVKLRRTFHAGELGRIDNVRDALIMGAERVGHGVKMNDDPVTLELARRADLGIEVSPVSNLRLKVVPDLKSHPFLKFLRLGLKVSLSTDDEGVLETDMNNECVQVVTQTDVSYKELRQMAVNSIETSFAREEEKQKLLAWLEKAFEDFERDWKAAAH